MRTSGAGTRTPGEPVVGLVLSGGGSRASFQIGALTYLYDRVQIEPSVIAGASVGSIVGSTLAQHADRAGQRRALGQLEELWRAMDESADMFVELEWFARLRDVGPTWAGTIGALERRRGAAHPLGRGLSRAPVRTSEAPADGPMASAARIAGRMTRAAARARANITAVAPTGRATPQETADDGTEVTAPAAPATPAGRPPAVGSDSGTEPTEQVAALADGERNSTRTAAGVVELIAGLRVIARARPDLAVILRGARDERSFYRPGPIVDRLLDPDVFAPARVAASGVTLRVAVVALESGELRFVTETGEIVDRTGARTDDPVTVDLVDAIRASCAIPAVFPPVRLGDEHYVDGGVREVLPAAMVLEHQRVDRCYAVVATPTGVPAEASFADRDLLSIVLRSTAGIMADEVLRDEVAYARAAGAVVVAPEIEIHDGLTVDPGLTAIAMDYGYVRAAEAVLRASAEEQAVTRELFTLRRRIWQVEAALLAQDADGLDTRRRPGSAEPGGPFAALGPLDPQDPSVVADERSLRAMRRDLRALVARVPPERLPPGADTWSRRREGHGTSGAASGRQARLV
ncbi:patatin-like phospholipase family protein [Actinotalea subterranea]|uniref:patatin-like phospholipase family protein n=1 Tax=Actinotalea subterranea TaxID=2607497 RepID=UPI0011EEE0CB|nr:patatin-like phospholipase family protein [Actinotalea subterranea]